MDTINKEYRSPLSYQIKAAIKEGFVYNAHADSVLNPLLRLTELGVTLADRKGWVCKCLTCVTNALSGYCQECWQAGLSSNSRLECSFHYQKRINPHRFTKQLEQVIIMGEINP